MTVTAIGVIDRAYFDSGIKYLCGVDEAGRGPLAGPVVAAAVILPAECAIQGITDSKKLTPKSRERLYTIITGEALAYSIAEASVEEIGAYNILNATLLAMKRAVEGLAQTPERVLIDGNKTPELDIPATAVVKGDMLSLCIAAASILAKVHRDRIMDKLDRTYPQYHLSVHKGYPTKSHYEALDIHGPCDIHRAAFLRKWAAKHEQR